MRDLLIHFVRLSLGIFLPCVWTGAVKAIELAPPKSESAIRIATFNVSLNRSKSGKLTSNLRQDDSQIKAIATIIRAVSPDILLLNEIDYLPDVDHPALLHELYLTPAQQDQLGHGPISLPYHFWAAVNTGQPSGLDLNRNGATSDPEDAYGFGRFPGQYGMAVLSKYPFDASGTRTFQNLLWSELPGALQPKFPDSSELYYSTDTWSKLKLPSKSFWDVRIQLPGRTLHLLASHPTPPAFDGPEDRNGCRNHDEIALLTSYIDAQPIASASGNGPFWRDDQGREGALPQDAYFVVAGDLNCDPVDGSSRHQAINKLLSHPRVQSNPVPQSAGGVEASRAEAGQNRSHRGEPAHDTGAFGPDRVGNLRVDYVLPSNNMPILDCGVVWPSQTGLTSEDAAVLKQLMAATDHRMVWVDLALPIDADSK
jgi:endonuclease/exonuclease/phosphatase family metal-dependent hydrolase